jgi:hypothetical protein
VHMVFRSIDRVKDDTICCAASFRQNFMHLWFETRRE